MIANNQKILEKNTNIHNLHHHVFLRFYDACSCWYRYWCQLTRGLVRAIMLLENFSYCVSSDVTIVLTLIMVMAIILPIVVIDLTQLLLLLQVLIDIMMVLLMIILLRFCVTDFHGFPSIVFGALLMLIRRDNNNGNENISMKKNI